MSAKGSNFKLSEEAKQKISAARKRRKETLGYINSPETRIKLSLKAKGKKWTKEHRIKFSAKMKGRMPKHLKDPEEFAKWQKKGHEATRKLCGPLANNWKGDNVGYAGVHQWVKKLLGKPKRCDQCGCTNDAAKRYEWANVSLNYLRDLTDWRRLCVSCHKKESFMRGEMKAWNKGLKIQSNTGRTHIKKGQRISPETEFKRGFIPHNKYLLPKSCKKCGKNFQPLDHTRKFCSRTCYWQFLKRSNQS